MFDAVVDVFDAWGGKLAVSLLQPFEKSDAILDILREVRREARDPHVLFSKIGEKLGLIPESHVRNAFVTIYCQAFPEKVAALLDQFGDLMAGP